MDRDLPPNVQQPSLGSVNPDGRQPSTEVRLAALGQRRSRNNEAYIDFYRARAKDLVTQVIMLGARPQDAADAAQEALIEALKRWPDLEDPFAWCCRVARRQYYRRHLVAEDLPGDLPETGRSLIGSGEDAISRLIERTDLVQLLQNLPIMQRTVMVMTWAGSTPAEIAEDLGHVTSDQVRANLRLARQRMRELVNGADPAEEDDR